MSDAAAAPGGDNGGAGAGAADEGQQAGNWMEGFDEDTTAFVKNKGWQNPGDILVSYRNLEKFAGGSKNLVEIPGEDADAESMGRFYDRLGRPKDVTGYGIQMPEGGDKQLYDWFLGAAHTRGLSTSMAKGLFDDWEAMSAARIEAMENNLKAQAEADVATLQKEMGKNYDQFINTGRRAAMALGYDEESLSNLEQRMGTGEMLKLFGKLGSKMGEDSFADGDAGGGSFGGSSAQAKQEIADLKLNQVFMDKYLSGDKDAVNKMNRLMEKAYG